MIGSLLICGSKIVKHDEMDLGFLVSNTFTGMWFLTVLFILSVVGAFLEKKVKSYRLVFWGLMFFAINFLPDFWMRSELIYMMPFFVCAIYCSKFDWSRVPSYVALISFLLFIIVFQYYTFDDSLYEMTDQWQTAQYYKSSFLRLFLGIFGSVWVLWLCNLIGRIGVLADLCIHLGVVTLPIYVIHQKFLLPFIVTGIRAPNIAIYFLATMIVICASLLLYKTLRINSYCKLFLFGED